MKKALQPGLIFGSQMHGLNSETISICGGILGGFTELLERSNLPKTLTLKLFGDVPRSNCRGLRVARSRFLSKDIQAKIL